MTRNPKKIVSTPRLLFRPDPVLGWALTPDHGVRTGFRQGVVQNVGTDGWRHVPGKGRTGPRIAIFGCSFTYGTGLADEETFVAQLQFAHPGHRILNRGIGGQGSVQNLLQLRREIAGGAIDGAIFAIISDHRFRNIAHPQKMRQYLDPAWYKLGVEQVPLAQLDAAGRVWIQYHPIWQPIIRHSALHRFLPDEYMITATTLAVLDLARKTAAAANIPLRFALLDTLDPAFNSAVLTRFPDTVDISTPYDHDHTFMPYDIHPNAVANTLFAARLAPLVSELSAIALGKGPAS